MIAPGIWTSAPDYPPRCRRSYPSGSPIVVLKWSVVLGGPAVLAEDLLGRGDAVEEHQAVEAAVAGVALLGVLREAPADLDASRVGGRGEIRLRLSDDPPGVPGDRVEAVEGPAVLVQRHGPVVEVEGRREEHPLAGRQDGLPVLVGREGLRAAAVDPAAESYHVQRP